MTNVTILVSNYYHMPVPLAPVAAQLDAALAGFDQAMRAFLPAVQVPAGSKIGYVDLSPRATNIGRPNSQQQRNDNG